jgi:hypothetical protein
MMGNGHKTKVEVRVVAQPGNGANSIDWSQSCRFIPPGNGKAAGNMINVTAPGSAEIIFDLDDRTGLDLQFLDTPTEAIWIANGGNCPQGAGDADGEFSIGKPNKKQLKVVDTNANNGEFCYSLNFDSRNGPVRYDPIIKNGP